MKTQKNNLDTVALNDPAQEYLLKLASFLEAKAYSPMTIRIPIAIGNGRDALYICLLQPPQSGTFQSSKDPFTG